MQLSVFLKIFSLSSTQTAPPPGPGPGPARPDPTRPGPPFVLTVYIRRLSGLGQSPAVYQLHFKYAQSWKLKLQIQSFCQETAFVLQTGLQPANPTSPTIPAFKPAETNQVMNLSSLNHLLIRFLLHNQLFLLTFKVIRMLFWSLEEFNEIKLNSDLNHIYGEINVSSVQWESMRNFCIWVDQTREKNESEQQGK